MLTSAPNDTRILDRDRYGTYIRFLQHFGEAFDAEMGGPQAFLVCLPPLGGGRAHFHDHDQFQVFFGGRGCTLGRSEVPPVLVHYTDAHTPYGPFAAGSAGMNFFTLRAEATTATMFMPEERHKLIGKPGRAYHAEVVPKNLSNAETHSVTLIEPETDGLAAHHLSVGPGGKVTLPFGQGAGGQYCIVVAGDVQHRDMRFPFQSCVFIAPGETAPSFQASPQEGFDIVVLQYPAAQAGFSLKERRDR